MGHHDGHRQRMKEKMLNHSDSLVAHEVVETLLYYAIPRKNVNELAHNLLDKFDGSIKNLLDADQVVLKTIDGIGENTACFLKTINKIIQIINDEKQANKKIKSLFDANERLIECFSNLNKEKLVMFFLGSDDLITGKIEFCSNETDRVNLDLVDIGKYLILHKPYAVLIAHNHLSGNPTPSVADDITTKRLFSFFQLNDVVFYDHLIYSEKEIFSYKRAGKFEAIREEVLKIVC